MKCALLFFSIIVLSTAYPFPLEENRRITIDEDGTITIFGEYGKKVVISKAIGHPGPKDVEISTGAFIKKINSDEETNSRTINFIPSTMIDSEDSREKRSTKSTKESSKSKDKQYKSQTDVLGEIFNEYRGIVDAKAYNDLLKKINSYVQSGEINEAVFNVLQSLDQYREAEKYGHQLSLDKPFVTNTAYPYSSNNYPAINYPYQSTYNPYLKQQEYVPNYRFGYNEVRFPQLGSKGFENDPNTEGAQKMYNQGRSQFYGSAGNQLPETNQFTPSEQQMGINQKQYQQYAPLLIDDFARETQFTPFERRVYPQQSTSSPWYNFWQLRAQNKPIY